MRTPWLRWAAAILSSTCALTAQATFHLFRIDQVYSNADGTVQYVVMRESLGANGDHLWSQQELETTNAAGVRKEFRFPSNLPSSSTARRSGAHRHARLCGAGPRGPGLHDPGSVHTD